METTNATQAVKMAVQNVIKPTDKHNWLIFSILNWIQESYNAPKETSTFRFGDETKGRSIPGLQRKFFGRNANNHVAL